MEFTYFLPDAVQEQAKERLERAARESEVRKAKLQAKVQKKANAAAQAQAQAQAQAAAQAHQAQMAHTLGMRPGVGAGGDLIVAESNESRGNVCVRNLHISNGVMEMESAVS
jgi:regulator of protease activity HflC (stomatin/prohibitin superfamily)